MNTASLLNDYLREQSKMEFVDVFLPGETGTVLTKSIREGIGEARIKTLSDSTQLNVYMDDVSEQLSKGRISKGIKKIVDGIVSMSWSSPNEEAGKFEISFLNGISANEVDLPDAFVLRKNGLKATDISRFVSIFTSIPIERRPKIIFDCEKYLAGSLDLLSYSKSMARTFIDSPTGLIENPLENRAIEPDSFINFYEANSLAACASVELPDPNNQDSSEHIRKKIVTIYLQVQAKKRLGIKFDAHDQVLETRDYLADKISTTQGADQEWYKQALFFFLLDEAYIDESASHSIEKAAALANELEDIRLEAHVGRMINLSAGISKYSSWTLQNSATKFGEIGDLLGRVYSLNNKIVNDVHLTDNLLDPSEGENLLEFSFRATPYCDRLSSICSTVGVNALLLHDHKFAIQCLEKGETSSGLRLHHLSARVNRLIAIFVTNGRVDEESISACSDSIIAAKMPKSLDYHHTYLFGNLEKMATSKGVRKKIQDTLIEEQYVDYTPDIVQSGEVLKFLAGKFRSISDGERYKGHRGMFFERYGLLPINHFIWS